MVTNDASLLKLKHEVLYRVAKAAYEDNLEEVREQIPFAIVPGPHAQYRCCVYREREVIRQRIRLAEGKSASVMDDHNIVQIISSACEGCPISRFVVTDNCQNCMGKACINACKFGAITVGRDRSYIDSSKCKECGMCAKACPYNAIAELMRPCKKSCPVGAISMEDNGTGIAKIDKDKCISCGACIHSCPFGAIGSKTYIVDIIRHMKQGKKVFAMLAPATQGQFGADITMESWREALIKIGFEDMIEVAVGADMTASAEGLEWMEAYEQGKKKTTSCCPAFVQYVQKFYPELSDMISETVSPMCATSRYIKEISPEAITVFIGPCIAKKAEAQEGIPDNADYALTYGEIRAMLKARSVRLEAHTLAQSRSTVFGQRFAAAGGVTEAVLQSMKEISEEKGVTNIDTITVHKCSGIDECKKTLLLLRGGRLSEDFVEGMMCAGGCVNGPSRHRSDVESRKDREQILSANTNEQIHKQMVEQKTHTIPMHRF